MKNVSEQKLHINSQNIYFVFNNFFPPENRAIHEIMWKNVVERSRPQMTIWRMRTACWIPKATNTLRLSNTHRFSTATMVARAHLGVTLRYIGCLAYVVSSYLTVNILCFY